MLAAIVLAAGQSKRMGYPKQLLPLKNKGLLLNYVLDLVLQQQIITGEIRVVLGGAATEIKAKLTAVDPRLKIVYNKHYHRGMLSSIQQGISDLPPTTKAFFLVLGDQPLLPPGIFNLLQQEFNEQNKIVRPVYKAKGGHPVLISTVFNQQIHQLSGDVGLRSLLAQYPQYVKELTVEDEGVVLDIDSPRDYQHLLSKLEEENL